MRLTAVAALISDLPEWELTAWVDRGWVHPEHTGPDLVFHEIDIARVRLINDLRTMMRVEDETLPLILSLLDQMYELRGQLRSVLRAIEAQGEPARSAILAAME